MLPWSERFFHRHGAKTIFIGRFFSILRVTAAWMAGVSHMRWWRFFAWNAAGGICWAVLVGLVAYFAGHAAADAIARYGLIAGVALVALARSRLRGLPHLEEAPAPGRERAFVSRRLAAAAAALAAVLLPGAQAAPRPVPAFEHVVVIVLENKERSSVLGNSAAPAFNALAARGAVLARYSGVTHPSLPNYLALVSGSTHGITDDCTSCTVAGRSLADTLQARGRTWKAYAEGLPRGGLDRRGHRPVREAARPVSVLPAGARAAGAEPGTSCRSRR